MRRDQTLRQDLRLNLLRADLLAGFERADSLHQCFFEGAPNCHRLAHGLHLWPQAFVRSGELLKLPLRNFYDYIVERGLETRWSLFCDVVRELVERVAHGQFGRDL